MYPDMDSESARLFDRACEIMPGGNSRETVYFPPYPLYAKRGAGPRVWDEDGIVRLDFVNSFSSAIHGHCHPKIVEAVKAQAEQLVCVAAPTRLEIELAEIIAERIPAIEQLRFCNSGTEAVMLSIKAARAHSSKPKIAKVEGSYHGTFDTAEVSQNPAPSEWGPDSAPRAVPTAKGTTKGVVSDVLVLPFNDVETSIAILDRNVSDLAAVLIDPVPARMAYIAASKDYLTAIRKWASENGVILIFDEVMTVRGGYNAMQGEYGIVPDMTTVGKIVGGGMPIGAFGGRRDIMSVFDARKPGGSAVPHGGSFNAHPVSMAAGIACMKLLDQSAFDHLARLGDMARRGLNEAFQIAGVPGRAYGYGSMIGFLFTDQVVTNHREIVNAQVSAKASGILFEHFLNNGVMPLGRGGLLLSTVMETSDIEAMLDAALGGLRKAAREMA